MRNASQLAGMSRRRFLRIAGWTGVALPLLDSCSVLMPPRRVSRADLRMNHACIGVGGVGALDVEVFRDNPRIRVTALCDVDSNHLNRVAERVPEVRLYSDYRDLFRGEGTRLDSVSIAVPAHMHFAIAAAAIRSGKHVCCHGPLGHNVAEVRALPLLAGRSGLVMAVNPRTASDPHREAVARWLEQERLGLVTRVYLVTRRSVAEPFRIEDPRPQAGEQPPGTLEWNLWLGTAPERSYVHGLYHPGRWRAWQDFGTGPAMDALQDLFEPVWRGLGLGSPLTIAADPEEGWEDSIEGRGQTWPTSGHVVWTFPGNEHVAGNELAVDWFDGDTLFPERIRALAGIRGDDLPPACAVVLGTEGTLILPLSGQARVTHQAGPAGFNELAVPAVDSYRAFVDSCFEDRPRRGNLDQAAAFSETLLLSNIAWRFPGITLHWDSRSGEFSGRKDANRFLSRTYRDGWHIGPF